MPRKHDDRRTFLKSVGAAATTVGLAGCAGLGGGPERDTFLLGAVTSLSGDLRFGGGVTQRGYDMWADTINREQGGIEIGGDTYEVEVEYADAQSNPSAGADAASQMINDGADALLGPYSSNVTLSVCPIAEQNSIPHITGSAESPQIWQEGYEYSFGTIPTVSIIGNEATSALLNLEPQPESVYVTGVNEPFSEATAVSMRTAAEDAGVTVENYELFPRDTDYTNVVSAAQNADPDLHLHGGHIGSHVDLVSAASQLGYTPNGFLMHYGVNTGSYKEGAGAQAPYTFGATVWIPSVDRSGGVLFDSPQAYADAAEAAYGSAPDYTQAGSTAAGIVYQEALKELNAAPPLSQDDKDELIGILEEIEVNTFYGNVTFEVGGEYHHNNINTQTLLIQLGEDGSPTIVGPEDAATGEPNYPVPAWDER
ncbi:amino acid ABC transporter substrate-binding protein [Halopenitus persicus]|uniref:Amino acid/amide ABC transporter substrate-binding protein, HAAT family n=1 Tax=Halopenitus persicus TaxID=1048396 RepID=A0A1H3EM92_9EURY|nr:amino acid ABC transporter substrate-binding protein [Halopenitus persicus]QHS17600.1 ABC transporter substrate-binding protein [haloarchaeon 3A1-DGR]SDX79278.1 amino acid/amide ABC transporter substrate-binding protein, HAAT family [Halopenitus persicus]